MLSQFLLLSHGTSNAITSQFFLNHSSIQANRIPPAQRVCWMSSISRASISPCSASVCPPWFHPCGWWWAMPRLVGTPTSAISSGMS